MHGQACSVHIIDQVNHGPGPASYSQTHLLSDRRVDEMNRLQRYALEQWIAGCALRLLGRRAPANRRAQRNHHPALHPWSDHRTVRANPLIKVRRSSYAWPQAPYHSGDPDVGTTKQHKWRLFHNRMSRRRQHRQVECLDPGRACAPVLGLISADRDSKSCWSFGDHREAGSWKFGTARRRHAQTRNWSFRA